MEIKKLISFLVLNYDVSLSEAATKKIDAT